jgi:hypothetical protein
VRKGVQRLRDGTAVRIADQPTQNAPQGQQGEGA